MGAGLPEGVSYYWWGKNTYTSVSHFRFVCRLARRVFSLAGTKEAFFFLVIC